MATLMDDALLLLQTAGVTTTGTNAFRGALPDSPDFALCVIPYGGPPATGYTYDGVTWYIARFQVLVRGALLDYDNPFTLATAAVNAFSDLTRWNQIWGSAFYACWHAGRPGFVGPPDAKGRPVCVANVQVEFHS